VKKKKRREKQLQEQLGVKGRERVQWTGTRPVVFSDGKEYDRGKEKELLRKEKEEAGE